MAIRIRMVSLWALLLVAVAGAVAALLPKKAYALPTAALSTIFLDANSNVIGQRILDCHGAFQHAGYDSSSPTVYQVEIEYNCTSANWKCSGNAITDEPECGFAYKPYAASVVSVITAQGFTVKDFCNFNIRNEGYFYGAPDCSYTPTPPKATNLTDWKSGPF